MKLRYLDISDVSDVFMDYYGSPTLMITVSPAFRLIIQ